MPPNMVGPFEEVIWACGGTIWGRSNSGVVRYSQVNVGGDAANPRDRDTGTSGCGTVTSAGASAANQTITIEWDNPWVLRPPVEDIRKFEASVSSRRCVANLKFAFSAVLIVWAGQGSYRVGSHF